MGALPGRAWERVFKHSTPPRANMDAPDAGRFTYVYDATNQITLLHNAFDERTSFAYDNAGRRTVKKLANGTRISYTYDAAAT
ncbi:MAG: RHS repeat domain-containing protein [Parvibaculaceae bacterium]